MKFDNTQIPLEYSFLKRKVLRAVILISCFTLLVYLNRKSLTNITWKSDTRRVQLSRFNFQRHYKAKNNSFCEIPKLQPFDESIGKYVNFTNLASELVCNLTLYPLLFDIEFKNGPTLVRLHPEDSPYTSCCFRTVERRKSKSKPDNAEKFSGKCKKLRNTTTKLSKKLEHIAILCNSSGSENVTLVDVFGLVPLKQEVEDRISETEKKLHHPKNRVNLVILGIDSMSHMSFKRSMPILRDYILQTRNAIGMNGYTRVGDNTYPNLVVVLSSLNEEETNRTCLKEKLFDDCTFLWDIARKRGYRTVYGEDNPTHCTFNYLKRGFRKQPTDYYLRPLARTAHKNIENGEEDVCYGPRFKLDFLLNYMKATYTTMQDDKRYFQFVWSTGLTHDCQNCGVAGEPKILEFMQWFEEKGGFNNSVVVLMSDHGSRYGRIRSTRQGKIEENMPFIYFMFPGWFRAKYRKALENIKANKHRLTSHYDTYETLHDILHLEDIVDKKIEKRSAELKELNKAAVPPRGISLFLPVPEDRTCATAQIEESYCTCHSTRNISRKSSEAMQAANYAVYKLNDDLVEYENCSFLALKSIQSALAVNMDTFIGNVTHAYQVQFTTTPGNATFDATVIIDVKDRFKVAGSISRTNMYGNQSYCVDDQEMKKYCYCRSFLNTLH